QLRPPPPIMIGQYQYSTSKDRKLAVSAKHRPDGEKTKRYAKMPRFQKNKKPLMDSLLNTVFYIHDSLIPVALIAII
ncbi:hypothetical protein ACLW9K_004361, partial [Shigella flexneri]